MTARSCPGRADLAVAVLLGAAGGVEGALLGEGTGRLVLAATEAAAGFALVTRRTNPAATAVVVATCISVIDAVEHGEGALASFVCLLLAVFSLGLHADRRTFRIGLAGTAIVVAGAILVTGEGIDDVVFAGSVVAGTVVPSRLLRRKLDEVAVATERAVRAEVEGEERARLAALEERSRLAYELHDIVGHSVSLMAVHAAAAEARLDDPELARTSLRTVQEVGRQAIADLARMLGLLRDDHAELGLAVQPGAGDLERLGAEARDGGDQLTLAVEGETARVPAALGLTVYRIVQEGLTNARRHAPGAPVRATVRIRDAAVDVEVVNGPRRHAAMATAPTNGTGTGLLGLHQRVGLFGGSIHTGGEPDGGFALRASLPLGAAP